jgi:hypothetical protein
VSSWTPHRLPVGKLKKGKNAMSTLINRILDVSASYMILALGLTIAGATAVVGA